MNIFNTHVNLLKLKQQILKLLTFIYVFIFLFSPAYSFSLNEAVQTALKHSPRIKQSTERQLATKYRVDEEFSGWLPVITLNSNIGRERTDTPSARATTNGNPKILTPRESSISLVQSLFQGFETKHRVAAAGHEYEESKYSRQEQAQTVALEVISAYLEIQRSEIILKYAKENILRHQEIVEALKLRAQKTKESVNVLQATGRLALAWTQHNQIEQNLKDFRSIFELLVGKPATNLTSLFNYNQIPNVSVDVAIDQAINFNPRIAAQKEIVRQRSELLGVSKASFYPRINLELSAQQDADISGISGKGKSAQAVVSLQYNLYQGGSDLARKKRTSHELKEARYRLQDEVREVKEEVKRYIFALEKGISTIKFRKKHTEDAKKVYAAYLLQQKAGRRTLLDLLDSGTELFTAELSQTGEEYQYLAAYYNLLTARGVLLNELETNTILIKN